MSKEKIKIGVITLSRISSDPRVRRQCELLESAGFEVFALGEDDDGAARITGSHFAQETAAQAVAPAGVKLTTTVKKRMPIWAIDARRSIRQVARSFVRWTNAQATRVIGRSPARFVQRILLVVRAQRCRLEPTYASKIFWKWNSKINDLYDKAKLVKCDIWLANDWITLPIAARLAAENGGVYIYDTHEFAIEEYQERWVWRLAQKPIVVALEGSHIRQAKLVTAVSSGIAECITRVYQLSPPVMTIRNTPRYVETSFRPTSDLVRVLYHGIVSPGRGLEAAIDSVSSWHADRQLFIRGPSSEHYLASLRSRIAKAGLQSRVFLLPPVPMTDLVARAAEFDIGFFALPGHSLHNQFALPNKFFEYAMAGLALCVSRLPEMTSLISQFQIGSTFGEPRPASIAAAINELSRDRIDLYKRNSLAAARELCWEREGQRLVSSLTALI